MTIKFYVVDSQYLCEVSSCDARLVEYEDYLRLRMAAVKALEALQWAWVSGAITYIRVGGYRGSEEGIK